MPRGISRAHNSFPTVKKQTAPDPTKGSGAGVNQKDSLQTTILELEGIREVYRPWIWDTDDCNVSVWIRFYRNVVIVADKISNV